MHTYKDMYIVCAYVCTVCEGDTLMVQCRVVNCVVVKCGCGLMYMQVHDNNSLGVAGLTISRICIENHENRYTQ